MARIKIDLPSSFTFSTQITIRITDLNYGGHVGNDTILSLIHEARAQFLRHYGYAELDFGGVGMIMGDVAIEFKNELFHGDIVIAEVAIAEISKFTFDLYYRLQKNLEGKSVNVAFAKTGMVCYDYANKKMAFFPDEVKQKFLQRD